MGNVYNPGEMECGCAVAIEFSVEDPQAQS